MKLISWNVNGIRACLKNDFLNSVKKINPDVLCIQETKAQPEQVDVGLSQFDHHYWNSAEKKGYSGTAVFSKVKPLSVVNGFKDDKEGRVITLEFKDYYLVNVYTPNSQRGLARIDYRKQWDKDFLAYLKKLEKTKPVICCGDLNCAHTEIDLKNPKSNWNKTAGYTEVECNGFSEYLKNDFVDTFRDKHPGEENHYSWWSYMFNARAKNVGWRIDYFLVSKMLNKQVKDAFILPEILGSDHCPVGLTLK